MERTILDKCRFENRTCGRRGKHCYSTTLYCWIWFYPLCKRSVLIRYQVLAVWCRRMCVRTTAGARCAARGPSPNLTGPMPTSQEEVRTKRKEWIWWRAIKKKKKKITICVSVGLSLYIGTPCSSWLWEYGQDDLLLLFSISVWSAISSHLIFRVPILRIWFLWYLICRN